MQSLKLSIAIFVAAACSAPALLYAGPEQLPGPAVEIQTEKNVVTQEKSKWWSINAEMGYWSTYIFRGTNLTPDSGGIAYWQGSFSAKGFTIGAWIAKQIGTARVDGATAVGESGSGISPYNVPGVQMDTAIQTQFNEIDAFASYAHSFGWIDVTFGNVAFFILRSEVDQFTEFNFFGPGQDRVRDFAVPENEVFDRIFIALSTNRIHPGGVAIIPTVTYYQTVYNHGDDPMDAPGIIGPIAAGSSSADQFTLTELGFRRNDNLGGYLESKIQAVIPIITDVLRLEPLALVSYSFGDRSEAVVITPADIGIRSSSVPLYGFNHFQTGAELVLQVNQHLRFIAFGHYARHLAEPTAGTDENEYWGGGKIVVSF